jgi:hypothetical protein
VSVCVCVGVHVRARVRSCTQRSGGCARVYWACLHRAQSTHLVFLLCDAQAAAPPPPAESSSKKMPARLAKRMQELAERKEAAVEKVANEVASAEQEKATATAAAAAKKSAQLASSKTPVVRRGQTTLHLRTSAATSKSAKSSAKPVNKPIGAETTAESAIKASAESKPKDAKEGSRRGRRSLPTPPKRDGANAAVAQAGGNSEMFGIMSPTLAGTYVAGRRGGGAPAGFDANQVRFNVSFGGVCLLDGVCWSSVVRSFLIFV